jgi:hypothetical protein
MGVDWWTGDAYLDSITSRCHRLSLKTGELRADVTRLLATSDRSPRSKNTLLALAVNVRAIDQEIATWMSSLPERYRFKTLYWRDDIPDTSWKAVDVFPGRVDMYPDWVIAHTWNMGRVARLILASLDVRLVAWLCAPQDYRLQPEYATSRQICRGIISEIVASVPYHLGLYHKQKEAFDRPAQSGFACGENDANDSLKVVPALLIVWPLMCIKGLDFTNEDQREWATGRLRFIADVIGLKYAGHLAAVSIVLLNIH